MPNSSTQVLFGPFVFDPSTGELSGDGVHTRLAPQVAAVLELLIRRPGEVVTRAELREALWPDTTVEFDQGLNFCVRQLRVALSDDAAQPKYIETLPKRGYRFVGQLAVTNGLNGNGVASDAPAQLGSRERSPSVRLALAMVVVVALVTLGLLLPKLSKLGRAPAVAVLRFDAVPADSTLDQYRLNLTEQIVTALSADRTNRLAVMGPTFTARFPGMQTSADSIRLTLSATHSLSGALRRTPSGTRIFAQVIQLADRRHVYAAVLFDSTGAPERMRAIADSIARAVRNVILTSAP